jgi:CRP/FNR family transcriptional regulator, nitrogen oxide reductase regulator
MTAARRSPIEPETIEPHMCSLDLRLAILGALPFFSSLSKTEIQQVNQSFTERGYQSGETIYYSGEHAERLYVVAAGKVKLLRHTYSGKDILLEVLKPGEFFGTLSTLGEENYSETAAALTSVCTLSIGSAEFRHILERFPPVSVAVLDTLSSRLQEAQDMVHQLSAHTVEQRIAFTLLKLAEKLGERNDVGLLIQMPLSRDDLAMMVGTTTETASRVMSQLQKDGLIRSGRQWVSITDQDRLRTLSRDQ